ncbi:purine-nucleoside phosphorylase [Aminobacter aganoensis]|uniref:Purine nucleoside phosphorylase DeoD-type n=1 Tax=Aminobacter aganoensis TaxID=83264 RepID=A0A7X0F323_9HYPH|nr:MULTISPECIES: purine-nucleoside phosphorylase [Aminobacter]KQU73602.1 purine nucleoside phosphorylase [Aminobacter sp. DSM 101952]MBB6352264.1 purine-nucleoside phosphorylase [Aminobacter aganoensis]
MQTTPHNEARRGDYAETVLLAGDPQRSEWIAATFLDGVRCVNRVRGALGYTGRFRGVPISVQTTGIGAPSMAIYAHELLDTYRARTLIRVGTCGGLADHVKLRSLVISQSSSNDGAVNGQLFGFYNYAPSADFGLLQRAAQRAIELGLDHHIGQTASSDVFYHPDVLGRFAGVRAHGALAVDMETSLLYTVAARFRAKALSICTVVDSLVTEEQTETSERQELFTDMVRLALEVAVPAEPATPRR